MIKEVALKSANNRTGYEFGIIEIKSQFISPAQNKIAIEEEIKYFKKIFDDLKIIEIKKQKGFKAADIVPIYIRGEFFCVSKKFKDIFEGKLKGYWYPTNDKNYFIFLLDNYIDPFNREKTIIKYGKNGNSKPYQYEFIENETYQEHIEENEYLFKVMEWYAVNISTEKFEQLVKENNLTGLQFYKDLNIKRKNGKEFDMFRWKKYDEEGNCLE